MLLVRKTFGNSWGSTECDFEYCLPIVRSPEKVVAFQMTVAISVGVAEYNRTGIYSREREGPLGVWRSTIIGAEAACSG